MRQPKLRDSNALLAELYPIGCVPADIIRSVGAEIVYMLYTGRHDMSGDDWGNIFASAIGGEHLGKPVGIADVTRDRAAWSMKTVKNPDPFTVRNVRLISGRCSPDYSYGIEDVHENVQRTGEAVLSIWNSRVDITLNLFPLARVNVLVRSADMLRYTLFEEFLTHYNLSEYRWEENSKNNLEGYDKRSGEKRFVWQPHGSQFTILSPVPDNAIHFKVRKPEPLPKETALRSLGFDDSWVEILDS